MNPYHPMAGAVQTLQSNRVNDSGHNPQSGQVILQRDRISDLVALNGKLIEDFANRLCCILSPTAPGPGIPPGCIDPRPASSLQADFREIGNRLDATNTMIQDLLSRLEV